MPGSFGRVAEITIRQDHIAYSVLLFDPLWMEEIASGTGDRVWVLEECDVVTEDEYDDLCREWCLTHPNYVPLPRRG
jgi:hypothetical protein